MKTSRMGVALGAALLATLGVAGCGQNGAEGTGWTRVDTSGRGSAAPKQDLAGVRASAVVVTYYYMPG